MSCLNGLLFCRVCDYISGGLSEILLIDPDNAKQTHQRRGPAAASAVLSTSFHHPLKEGWTGDLSQVSLHFLMLDIHWQEVALSSVEATDNQVDIIIKTTSTLIIQISNL